MFNPKLMTEKVEALPEQQRNNEIRPIKASSACADEQELRNTSKGNRALESVFIERQKEQLTSDIVTRLYENGYTQDNWECLDKQERLNTLQEVATLMSQEMLFPPELRENLKVCFTDQPKSVSFKEVLHLNSSLLERDDASEVYANLYNSLKNFPVAESESLSHEGINAYASAKVALSQSEMDSFAVVYREGSKAVAFKGGLSATQGLKLAADHYFSQAKYYSRVGEKGKAEYMNMEGRRLMRMYNANKEKAHQKKS